MNNAERFRQLTCTQRLKGDLKRSSVRAAAFTWLAGAADFVLRIGSTAILARLVLPEYFGLVMMVTAVTAIADQFRDLGLSSATVQRKDITCEEVNSLFWINASAGLLLALVVCAASPLISAYYKEPRLTAITCILATNFIWGGLLVQHQALLARQLRLGHSASVRVLAGVLSTFLAIALAWFGFGYWALVWREVARNVLLTVGVWICFPWVPGLPSRKTDIRALLGFGTHMAGANIAASITGAMDRILLGRFRGPEPVAMYRQAYQLLVMPMEQLVSPVYQVTQPGLSMIQTDAPRFRRFYQKVLTLVGLATMPLSVFVAIYSTEITSMLLGRRWFDAGPILTILSFGTFVKQPVSSAAFVLVTRGLSKTYFALSLVQNTVFVSLVIVGVHWGARGVAAADVATTYLLIGPYLYFCLKGSPVSVGAFVSAIARPAVASLAMAVALLLLRIAQPNLPLAGSLVLGCCLAIVIFPAAWMLMPGGKDDLKALINDLRTAFQQKATGLGVADPVAVAD